MPCPTARECTTRPRVEIAGASCYYPRAMAEDVSTELKEQIKTLIVERLKLDVAAADIGDTQPLFGEGLGLDSIDALELVLGIEQQFGVKVEDEAVGAKALSSVESLAQFVASKRAAAS